VNKEREVRTRIDKEFQIFEGFIRNFELFIEANKEFVIDL
jgi:hypothetical protein